MRLGIDASNIRGGGGVTHLKELLAAAEPAEQGIERVLVWAGRATLDQLPSRAWLDKLHHPWLDRNLVLRLFWQRRDLPRLARRAGCSILFCPGGLAPTGFHPVVTMCRNMLPFEPQEMRRYGMSLMFVRLWVLRWAQAMSFRKADGVIFLSSYAQQGVTRVAGAIAAKTAVIAHGVGDGFFCPARRLWPAPSGRNDRPFRILYVSIVEVYKHQWHVAEAVARLRQEGFPVSLELVGPAYPPALRRLEASLRRLDGAKAFIHYRGSVPYERLPEFYRQADLFVFASSCENLPNILLESMAAGLPIACSNRGPMREVLGEAGVYFNPEDPGDIARAIRELIVSPELRAETSRKAFERAQRYSWTRCAEETFSFLARVAREKQG